jgi:hypothetical protein
MDFVDLQKQNRYCEKLYKLLRIYEEEKKDTKENLYTFEQTIKLDKMYFNLLKEKYASCR